MTPACRSRQPERAPRLALWLLLPFLGLAGCATLGPEFQPPTSEAPQSWNQWHSGPADTAALPLDEQNSPSQQWWRTFNDTRLNDLQQRLDNSPDLQEALLNFARARLQRQLVTGEQGIQLDASGSAGRQKISSQGAEMRLASIASSSLGSGDTLVDALGKPFNLYQVGFDASWELDLWGQIERSIEAATASADAAGALLEQSRITLNAELARLYFELRAVQAQRRLLQQQIDLEAQRLQLQQAQVDAGLGNEMELETRHSRLAAQRAARAPLEAQETELRNAIALLLGERPGALSALLNPPREERQALDPNTPLPLGIPSELARRRPDIRAAEAQLHAATAEIGVAMADLYPRVTLSAGFSLESVTDGNFGEWSSRQWSLGPGFYLPIFHQGRLRTRVELTRVAQQRAAIAYHKTVLSAWQEIDNSLSRYRSLQARQQQLQRQLTAARRRLELVAASESAGLTDYRETLNAREALLSLERQLIDSRTQLKIARVAVYKAVGGGLRKPEAEEEPNAG